MYKEKPGISTLPKWRGAKRQPVKYHFRRSRRWEILFLCTTVYCLGWQIPRILHGLFSIQQNSGHSAVATRNEPTLNPWLQHFRLHRAATVQPLSLTSAEHDPFPEIEKCAALVEKAEFLPDFVFIPFEDVVVDDKLKGWEDKWIAKGEFDASGGKLREPSIDFVYLWVNGSEEAFLRTMYPYEKNSTLNEPTGQWLEAHRKNRYRDWDELRYSIRSVEKFAGNFRNKIQILVNAVKATGGEEKLSPKVGWKQSPTWLKRDKKTRNVVQILSQEEFFENGKSGCLPTFNSLTIENQIFGTRSDTDRIFALSDDMLLGEEHAASDIYSPLFGPVFGFKTNAYSTTKPPTEADAKRFGEKPHLIYTSWLLNQRFGNRKRNGQAHFGHSISRTVSREAISSFPRPELQSALQRFRGELSFQLYSWYVAFHYTIERHREALIWSYLFHRADSNQDSYISWDEREVIMNELEEGMANEGNAAFRIKNFYRVKSDLEKAGLNGPKVNAAMQWTSLDGPLAIRGIKCLEFDVDTCLAPGFSMPDTDKAHQNPVFSTASIFDRLSRQNPSCGDCFIKLLLNRVRRGLSPMLPPKDINPEGRRTVIKTLMRYQYSVIEPTGTFVMITDAEQVETTLIKKFIKDKKTVPQLCLNDDVASQDDEDIEDVRRAMTRLFQGLFPIKTPFEL